MIRYRSERVRRHMAKQGWKNANQLAVGASVTAPFAARVLAGQPLKRLVLRPLLQLASVLGVDPWSLLEYRRNP